MIGGRILDGSALAALAEGSDYMRSWSAVAAAHGLTLYVPGLALAEARALRPESAGLLDIFAAHPEVYVVPDPDRLMRRDIDALHDRTGTWDPTAAWVVLAAKARGWEVLTRDAERLRRLDATITVDVLP